ncbi:hypothetical protein EDD11_008664 [Mortierella claussenii]|nr:hypothetical protein EDD11_008664 [Mortierella claussenii]
MARPGTNVGNIIEIPEVAWLIGSYLAPADLAFACRVRSTWFVPFASQLWRSIQVDQWTHDAFRRALPRYSHYIRELNCSVYEDLSALPQSCTELRVFRAPSINNRNVKDALSILRHCSNLEDLYLPLTRMKTCISVELIQTIADLKRLKSLSLRELTTTPDGMDFLLEKLPQLQHLSLHDYREYKDIENGEDQGAEELVPGDSGCQDAKKPVSWPLRQEGLLASNLQLQSLHIDGYQRSFESILGITRISPLLESLSLSDSTNYILDFRRSVELGRFVQQLPRHCPRLTNLTIHALDLDSHNLGLLLSAIPDLKVLRMIDFPPIQLCQVIRHRSLQDTLEHLYIETGRGCSESSTDAALVSSAVLWMLRRFPKLKTIVIPGAKVEANSLINRHSCAKFYEALFGGQSHGDEHNALDDMDTHYEDGNFVCRDLTMLWITVRGQDMYWAPPFAYSFEDQSFLRLHQDHGEEEEELETVSLSTASSSQRMFKVYDAVVEQLRTLSKLDINTVQFDYIL